MLTSFDDFPIHQTPLPVAHTASSDANAYDRYFFDGYTRDSSLYFGLAMGLYPNRQVIDAAFSVVEYDGTDGVQSSVHASGIAPLDRRVTTVGPIAVEVVEPLKVLRLTVAAAPDRRIAADLTFVARTVAIEEPRFSWYTENRVVFDYTRLTQFGTWTGWIQVDGRKHEISADTTWGCRDRSWGIRPVGEQLNTGAPGGFRQFYWLWSPTNFDDRCIHFSVNERADGSVWHHTAADAALGTADSITFRDAVAHVDWEPGTRRASHARIELFPHDRESAPYLLDLEPRYSFYMRGIGYTHPEWGHGVWKGELAVGEEQWRLSDCDPLDHRNVHIQALCDATLTEPNGRVSHGQGILEQFVVGPHLPSGMTGLFDGAKP